jgi:hypothetical protein
MVIQLPGSSLAALLSCDATLLDRVCLDFSAHSPDMGHSPENDCEMDEMVPRGPRPERPQTL